VIKVQAVFTNPDQPFTLFINALPRDHEEGTIKSENRLIPPKLAYVGIPKHKELLETATQATEETRFKSILAWEFLRNSKQLESHYTHSLYQNIQNGEVGLSDLQFTTLADYLSIQEYESNPFIQAERTIFTKYLRWQDYHYTSIPLIQFGELDGIVHIIYHSDNQPTFFNPNGQARTAIFQTLINTIRISYENLILDEDLNAKNTDENSIQLNNFKARAAIRVINPDYDRELFKRLQELTIFKELGLHNYYEINRKNILDRISTLRTLIAFPDIKYFYDNLYDRLYMLIQEFFLQYNELPFVMFITALPRDHEVGTTEQMYRLEKPELFYVGNTQQEKMMRDQGLNVSGAVTSWSYLSENSLVKSGSTDKLYLSYQLGELKLETIQSGSIKTYLTDPQILENEFTKAEFSIITMIENWEQYNYFSIPLIQFGEFDGIIHIIYHEKEHKNFFRENTPNQLVFKRLINAIRIEYEGLMLDWQVQGENFDFKEKIVKRVTTTAEKTGEITELDPDFDNELFQRINELPILKQLRVKEYYQRHRHYLESRYKMADKIPDKIEEQYRNKAAMSVVMDSYTHNITAHSLTALSWLFRQRFIKCDYEDMMGFDQFMIMAAHPYFKYLHDKGAFWTGLLRGHSFGGSVRNLYDVIWEGLCGNPLFLGSIAFSEGIYKVKVYVSFLETIRQENAILSHKKIKATGLLYSVDLTEVYEKVNDEEESLLDKSPITEGEGYKVLKPLLEQVNVFLPGTVVGMHAFYTIIENELRNVKHYGEDVRSFMRRDGLSLHISIEEMKLSTENSTSSEYYQIGVWLEHPVELNEKRIAARLKKHKDDIIDPKAMNRPVLGGTSQDKICAAFLFNSSFDSLDKNAIARVEAFEPWIKLGSSPIKVNSQSNLDLEYCIAANIIDPASEDDSPHLSVPYPKGKGVFKKFFNLWKGSDVYDLPDVSNIYSGLDTTSRFRFVNINNAESSTHVRLRQEGFIRIIRQSASNLEEAYLIWLKNWLNTTQYRIKLCIENEPVAFLDYHDHRIDYVLAAKDSLKLAVNQTIDLNHNENSERRVGLTGYRSHGAFMTHFFQIDDDTPKSKLEIQQILKNTTLGTGLGAELLETLASKVVIFDNRIANRLKLNPPKPELPIEVVEGNIIQKQGSSEKDATTSNALDVPDIKVLKDQLLCEVYHEQESLWNIRAQNGFRDCHILVLHLSFINSFEDENGQSPYSENDIQPFIEEQILKGQAPDPNFLLVITTGRSRYEWWENLKKNTTRDYTNFVYFRPIESILAAVEDGLAIGDDIDLKYRLTKILFGS
jgi:hypothetical protein